MLIFLLLVCGALLVIIGLYKIADFILVFPSKKTKVAFRQLFDKKDFKQRMNDTLLKPIACLISKALHISEYKKRQMIRELDRVGMNQTPEEFIAENITRSIMVAVLGLLFVPMGMSVLSIMMIILAVMLYQKNSRSIKNKIAEINKEIESELPRLVETLNYTLSDNNDLIIFFERYRRVAGKAMSDALDRLILNMKTGNLNDALRDFDKSISLPHVSTLVATLLGITYGIDQRTTLIVMEKDFRSHQRELLRREIDKRPRKIKLASIILTISMIALMMIPLVIMIIQSFGETGLI